MEARSSQESERGRRTAGYFTLSPSFVSYTWEEGAREGGREGDGGARQDWFRPRGKPEAAGASKQPADAGAEDGPTQIDRPKTAGGPNV